MTKQNKTDPWEDGDQYEKFMGRWSKLISRKFLAWLDVPPDRVWLDLGCGTGSLTKLLLENYRPEKVIAVDSSGDFIAFAEQSIVSPVVHFQVGLAEELDLESGSIDASVSGIMLNFVSHPERVIAELKRVTKPGGIIGIFVWDYSKGMEMLRYFWDAAVELDADANEYDEGIRFPLCREGQLESLIRQSGVKEVEAMPLEENIVFSSFHDYWHPFLGNIGPAPGYLMSLQETERQKLEDKLRESLPAAQDGSISLKVKAWAVKCKV